MEDIRKEPLTRMLPRTYCRPVERPFLREERDHVTVLFGGLTERHHVLIRAAGKSLNYTVDYIPTPTRSDYQTGREYADTGMCNPLYFTLGSLINYLKKLQKTRGYTKEEIIEKYVYVIAGSCGPCRFGMYETQFRLALSRSGFEGFRILTFGQKKLNQPSPHTGLVFGPRVFLPLFLAVLIADVLNDMANQIRPYEIVEGQTELVFGEVTERIASFLEKGIPLARRGKWFARLLTLGFSGVPMDAAQQAIWVLRSKELVDLLRQCAKVIQNKIEVNYAQPKPICKITGEFWAQTTEGDGNFRIFAFLESEGAEVITEPLCMWFLYLAVTAWNRVSDEAGLLPCSIWKKLREFPEIFLKNLRFRITLFLVTVLYNRIREALGGIGMPLPDQFVLQRLAAPYYNRKCRGGESYLEIAKTIYYSTRNLAHLILSLKPFGCLPSTQSDGVQSLVLSDHPDITYLPIETSGDGEYNAYSRVQMILTDAKDQAREEYQQCLRDIGLTHEKITYIISANRELRKPLGLNRTDKNTIAKATRFARFLSSKGYG